MAGRHRRRPQRREQLGKVALALSGTGTVVAVLTGAGSPPAPAVAQTQPAAGKPITSTDASSSRGLSTVTPVTQPQPIHADVSTVAQKLPTLASRLTVGARSWIGTPYEWGGNTKSGVDCSGLVQQVLKSEGISAPRTAAAQAKWTDRISKSEARAGDLVFGVDDGVHHVGIYLGDGKMIDAPTYGKTVGVHKLYSDMTLFGRIPS